MWGRATMELLPRLALWAGVRLMPGLTLTGRGLKIKPSDNIEMLRALSRDPLVIKATRVDTIYGLVDLMDAALASAPLLDAPMLVMYGAKDEIVPQAPIRRFVAQPAAPMPPPRAGSPGTRTATTCCCAISKARSSSPMSRAGSSHPARRCPRAPTAVRRRPSCTAPASCRWTAADPCSPWSILQLLVLLMLANGTPVVAKKILGDRFSYPLDGDLRFVDGRPLFGRSKTIRGVVLAVLVTTAGAPLIGLELEIGLAGRQLAPWPVTSSRALSKRRLDLPPSSRASGLDQVPEALFPLLACRNLLSLTMADIGVRVGLFFIGEVVLSRAALLRSPARSPVLAAAQPQVMQGNFRAGS